MESNEDNQDNAPPLSAEQTQKIQTFVEITSSSDSIALYFLEVKLVSFIYLTKRAQIGI